MAFLKHIGSLKDLETLLDDKKDGLVVIDFHAAWCGPCHQIAPIYAKLSDTYRHVTFTKVDVDQVQPVAVKYNVTAMPTFLFIKNKAVVHQREPAVDQVIEIPQDKITDGKHIPLRFVRFQTVNSLHIFVASNHDGEDKTQIDAIDVFGVPVATTKDLSGLKRQDD
ncbi:hypothetical protein M422DRAFT_51880 [Sphaerobolus stellatus SS14]|uniref:Thioredoxin n=1 Tax=Sphaerobolus stellatus (strain SS14) TaxID=990650 RepID=A0A0C9VBE6_SPHS4|nr:hypothetical protein M422DRAFT_51880 [Sphaerobolus stellatus SS14]